MERLPMNWRNIIIGAILTLIVTVIGGLLVVLLTRPPALAEKLVYTIDPPVTFDAKDTKISLVSAKIANIGTATASDVVVTLSVDEEISIAEHRVHMSSGPAAEYKIIAEEQQITVSLDHYCARRDTNSISYAARHS
jgi:hypothetical protein